MTDQSIRITELRFDAEELARLDLPRGSLRVTRGIGSGMCADAGGRIWAVGDRGPNLSVALATERYGLAAVARHGEADGAKVMPCLDIGPAMAELAVEDDTVRIVRVLPLADGEGRLLSGLPVPGTGHAASEPALGLDGGVIAPDPTGADTEGIAPADDGGFWIGDEYGPSLLRVDGGGRVVERLVPAGTEAAFSGSRVPVRGALPAVAARRRLNRGFEALAATADGRGLFLAFQSPLAHPDDAAHRAARHVRLWRLDPDTGEVAAEWLYPFDPPETFRRDLEQGVVEWRDLKMSELLPVGGDRLVVLERGSRTTKLYVITPDTAQAVDPAYLDVATRPTLEELSAAGAVDQPVLGKWLVLSSDEHPALGPDLEGMALLPDGSLLLVNDNDFGVEGVATRFWRVEGLSLAG